MKLLRLTTKLNRMFLVGVVCLVFSAVMMAQVKTESTTTKGQPSVETTVERGEVVTVSGNDLVVKMEDGQIRHFPNVPDSTKITVDGQQLSVHDLKPGMKLERTITTTTTPQTVKTVQTVTGRVFQVMPPNTVILTLEDGKNQQFKIPKGQKFNIEGQETDAFGLRKGMKISATRIVEAPENVVAQERKVTGHEPAPPAEQIQGPLLIVVPVAVPEPAAVAQAEPAQDEQAKQMPQTAGELPLFGLIGALALLSGLVLSWAIARRRLVQ
jgi:RNase P/RNase MRP subunit p29